MRRLLTAVLLSSSLLAGLPAIAQDPPSTPTPKKAVKAKSDKGDKGDKGDKSKGAKAKTDKDKAKANM